MPRSRNAENITKHSIGLGNCQGIFTKSTFRMNEKDVGDGWGRVYGGALRQVAEDSGVV